MTCRKPPGATGSRLYAAVSNGARFWPDAAARRMPGPAACALFCGIGFLLGAAAQTTRPSAARVETEAHIGKATQLMQDRLFSEAGDEFERALAGDPENSVVRFQYAACLFSQGRNEEARQQFEAVRQQK